MQTFGFTLTRTQDIPELHARAKLYQHEKTGAELLSIEIQDENKCFGISFGTPTTDSTGVAHILEHSVLAGSRKYPLKDPFAELLKGSMQTFLNAFTFPDKTCYPVASTNLRDFYNLIDVYLDTVFHPLLREETFKQQGWHYIPGDTKDALKFKGVVYNEMKGVYSSPESLLGRYIQQSLHPDTLYGLDSGGDPREIPSLTFEAFREFHKRYYHPSNSMIYFYGDDEPEERLRIVSEYLDGFDKSEKAPPVPLQPRFSAPKTIQQRYPAGEHETPKEIVTVNWLLSEKDSSEKVLSLVLLTHILAGTAAAPLKKALIASGFGESVTGGGLSTDLREMSFSIGLKGVKTEYVKEVETLILSTLKSLAEDGIDRKTIEASVNTIEFLLRENNTGGYPRGLLLMIRALGSWLHGEDPIKPLYFEEPLRAVKEKIASDSRYFEKMIEEHLLTNTHRTTLHMMPDTELSKTLQADEEARLSEIASKLARAERDKLEEELDRLKHFEATPDSHDAIEQIPTLHLEDIDRENKKIPTEVYHESGATILYHDLVTNGIIYLDVGFDLTLLPPELLPYITIFSRSVLEAGTKRHDFVSMIQRMGSSTGGFSSAMVNTLRRDTRDPMSYLFFRAKSTTKQADAMLDIAQELLLETNWDNRERIREIILQEKAGMESRLIPSGHVVVNSRIKMHYNISDWSSEEMGGLSYLFFLRRLIRELDEGWESLQATFERIQRILMNRSTMVVNATIEREGWQQLEPKIRKFVATIPEARTERPSRVVHGVGHNEGLILPAQVYYVGKGADLYSAGYKLHGSAFVISRYLRSTWLWEKVRVQGGAYGSFSLFDQRTGMFTYLSYRDPNLEQTIDVYDQTEEFLKHLHLTQKDLVRGIIGTISDVDGYQLPDAKGFTALVRYLAGDTDDTLQRLREEVLSTEMKHFREFGEMLSHVRNRGRIVVLGGQEAILRAKDVYNLAISKVM